MKYVQAFATGVDFANKQISCIDLYEHFEDDVKLPRNEFKMSYDKLVLAVGTKSNTFGVPGIASEEEAVWSEHNPTGKILN